MVHAALVTTTSRLGAKTRPCEEFKLVHYRLLAGGSRIQAVGARLAVTGGDAGGPEWRLRLVDVIPTESHRILVN